MKSSSTTVKLRIDFYIKYIFQIAENEKLTIRPFCHPYRRTVYESNEEKNTAKNGSLHRNYLV